MHLPMNDPRHIAHMLVTLRVLLIRKTIADLSGDVIGAAKADGNMDGIAEHLPYRLQTAHAQWKYVGYPARRTIERYGILALAETAGHRP